MMSSGALVWKQIKSSMALCLNLKFAGLSLLVEVMKGDRIRIGDRPFFTDS